MGRHRTVNPERGAALLVVIASTSALSVLASLLLLASLAAYQAGGYRSDSAQARLLAAAVSSQAERALAVGQLVPRQDRDLEVVNGVLVGSGGAEVPVGVFPRPDDRWPPVIADPPVTPDAQLGVGCRVWVAAVLGPRGDWRGRSLARRDNRLVDVRIEVWFRRARIETRARFVLWDDGSIERLD